MMPIVAMPDGTQVSFPDTMPRDQIRKLIEEKFPNVASKETVGVGTAIGRGAAQGLTANFYDELRGLMEAGGLDPKEPASLLKLVQGAYQYFTGDQEAAGRYEAGAKRVRGELEAARRDQPIATIGGELAGGLALPVGAAASAATLPGRMLAGAGVGAGYGALSGAGAGTDTASRATGAAIGAPVGAVVGGVAPAVVTGVGKVVSNIRGKVNPEQEAFRRIGATMGADTASGGGALSPTQYAAERAAGTPVALADLGGETTRALARAAANTSPVARQTIESFASDRFGGQTDRAVDFLSGLVRGKTSTESKEALEVAAKAANSPAYRVAYEAGDKPIWSTELEHLASSPTVRAAMKKAESEWRDWQVLDGYGAMNPYAILNPNKQQIEFLNSAGQPTFPNIQYWDYTARVLAGLAQAARTAGNKTDATRFGGLEKNIKSALDKMVPEFRAARSGARGFFQSESAIENGADFVTSKVPIAEARKAIDGLSAPDRELFKIGFVSELIEKVKRVSDRQDVVKKIGASADSRERLTLALGPGAAKDTMAFLEVEAAMDKLRQSLGNSTTARQLAERALASNAVPTAFGLGTYYESATQLADPQAALKAALAAGLAKGNQAAAARINNRVAEILMSSDPQILLEGIRQVAKNDRLRERIANIARNVSTRALTLPVTQQSGALARTIMGQ